MGAPIIRRRQHRFRNRAANGFSILEALIATVILIVGLSALLGLMAYSLQAVKEAQNDAVAKAKAQEALESVVAAKTTGQITFAQIQNASSGGVFQDGLQPLLGAGPDGLIGTADDTGQEYSAPSGDSDAVPLTNFQRQIVITSVTPELSAVTVTVQYTLGSLVRQQTVYTTISPFR